MSADEQGGAGRREVAYRLFAAEFEDADFSYSESDEERAPNYVVTPTGARVNRLFAVGVLTEVDEAGEDILRARVVDPTGAFVVYAGQYQPDAQTFFERADPPAFVAVTGKARTFQPDDSDVVYTSVRPETANEVTAETRDRWNVEAARQTVDRVATTAGALAREERGDDLRAALEAEGVDAGLAAGVALAIDHYGTTPAYLDAVCDLAVQVAELVAGERDEVDALTASPDAPGDVDLASLTDAEVPASPGRDAAPGDTAPADAAAESTAPVGSDGATAESGTGVETDTGSSAETATGMSDEVSEQNEDSGADTDVADATASDADGDDSGVDGSGVDESGTGDADESGVGADSSVEPEVTATGEPDELDETGETEVDPTGSEGAVGDVGEFEPGEFELDEDERAEIEAEYGTDFESGTEVDDPGEAGIETPGSERGAEPDAGESADSGAGAAETEAAAGGERTEAATGEDETGTEDEGAGDVGSTADGEVDDVDPATDGETDDVDVETAVMEAMAANDDGDGAAEAAIVEDVTARLGVDEATVEDALQEALMGGKCYEPEDGVYKPI